MGLQVLSHTIVFLISIDVVGFFFYQKVLVADFFRLKGKVVAKDTENKIVISGSDNQAGNYQILTYKLIIQLTNQKTVSIEVDQDKYNSTQINDELTVTRIVSNVEKKRLYFYSVFSRKPYFYIRQEEAYSL